MNWRIHQYINHLRITKRLATNIPNETPKDMRPPASPHTAACKLSRGRAQLFMRPPAKPPSAERIFSAVRMRIIAQRNVHIFPSDKKAACIHVKENI